MKLSQIANNIRKTTKSKITEKSINSFSPDLISLAPHNEFLVNPAVYKDIDENLLEKESDREISIQMKNIIEMHIYHDIEKFFEINVDADVITGFKLSMVKFKPNYFIISSSFGGRETKIICTQFFL